LGSFPPAIFLLRGIHSIQAHLPCLSFVEGKEEMTMVTKNKGKQVAMMKEDLCED
jgi:hypothetical protein